MAEKDEAPLSNREAEFTLDPFTPRLAFVDRCSATLKTAGDSEYFQPITPIDTTVDRFIDVDKLEKLAMFQGLFQPPSQKPESDFPEETTEALANREPQFILRNLARMVKHADPDEPLELDRLPSGRVNVATSLEESRNAKLDRPELLEEMTTAFMQARRSFIKNLYQETRWEEHFCREIKEDFDGPIWRYDPSAEVDDESQAENETEGD